MGSVGRGESHGGVQGCFRGGPQGDGVRVKAGKGLGWGKVRVRVRGSRLRLGLGD